MLTNVYTRATPFNEAVAAAAQEIFDLLLTRQAAIASMDYLRRSAPHLADVLAGKPFTVDSTTDGVKILIDYPATIRFLDLKKTAAGKKKRYYTPIYNRPLFGHLYGRGYSLSNVVNAVMQREYDNYYENLKNAFTSTNL